MSMTDAVAFIERAETDKEFAADLETAKGDQQAVLAKVRGYGYDVSEEEVIDAFTERYGVELTPEQLEAIAGGYDGIDVASAVAVGAATGITVVAVTAAFAA